MEIIALALSLVAVILCIVILTKVNKLLTMLRTPIFKKLTPDMNLKPSARRPISAQEMAQRGERNNKENRQNKERPANNNKDNRNQQAAQAPATRDRNEQHQRPERGPRRERAVRNARIVKPTQKLLPLLQNKLPLRLHRLHRLLKPRSPKLVVRSLRVFRLKLRRPRLSKLPRSLRLPKPRLKLLPKMSSIRPRSAMAAAT